MNANKNEDFFRRRKLAGSCLLASFREDSCSFAAKILFLPPLVTSEIARHSRFPVTQAPYGSDPPYPRASDPPDRRECSALFLSEPPQSREHSHSWPICADRRTSVWAETAG